MNKKFSKHYVGLKKIPVNRIFYITTSNMREDKVRNWRIEPGELSEPVYSSSGLDGILCCCWPGILYPCVVYRFTKTCVFIIMGKTGVAFVIRTIFTIVLQSNNSLR